MNGYVKILFQHGKSVVMIVREKHSDTHYVLANIDEFKHLCLLLLWERYHLGYYATDSIPPKPPISKKAIESWTDSSAKRSMVGEWERYEDIIRRNDRYIRILELAEEALRNHDGMIAYTVLKECCDHEYEGLEIIEPSKPNRIPQDDLVGKRPYWLPEE